MPKKIAGLQIKVPDEKNTNLVAQLPSQKCSPRSAKKQIPSKLSEPFAIQIIEDGDGENFPKERDIIEITYEGRLLADNSVFEAQTYSFAVGVGRVIRGWDEALLLDQISLGTTFDLTVRSDYGYGSKRISDAIPANSDLIFTMTLQRINKKTYNSDDG